MEPVVILHGLGRTSSSMRKLGRRVEEAGFDAVMINYPSRKATISGLVQAIWPHVPLDERVHFVGHSLGGILAKDLMRRVPDKFRGRIVQLGAEGADAGGRVPESLRGLDRFDARRFHENVRDTGSSSRLP